MPPSTSITTHLPTSFMYTYKNPNPISYSASLPQVTAPFDSVENFDSFHSISFHMLVMRFAAISAVSRLDISVAQRVVLNQFTLHGKSVACNQSFYTRLVVVIFFVFSLTIVPLLTALNFLCPSVSAAIRFTYFAFLSNEFWLLFSSQRLRTCVASFSLAFVAVLFLFAYIRFCLFDLD